MEPLERIHWSHWGWGVTSVKREAEQIVKVSGTLPAPNLRAGPAGFSRGGAVDPGKQNWNGGGPGICPSGH